MNNSPQDALFRDFKGIWIPREIWLHPDLLPVDKLVWAEIHSLYSRKKGGCYASNQYLMNFFNLSERYIREIISRLKSLDLIEEVSFDGRQRVIRAKQPLEDFSIHESEVSAGLPGTPVPGREEPQFRSDQNHSSGLSYTNSKVKKKEYKQEASPPMYMLSFGLHVKLKKEDYDKLVKDHGIALITQKIEDINDGIESKGYKYKCFAATIRNWIKRDKQKSSKPNHNDSIPISVNKDLQARLSSGRVEVGETQYKLILKKSQEKNDPEYAQGYRYKNQSTGQWVET